MSDLEDSTVTYREVSSPFQDLSDIGSPRVDGLPMMLEDPYFMSPEVDVLPVEDHPLPAAISPTANLPGYITESNPEEDLEEDDEDYKEDLADYPNDRDDDEDR
ncbi:hypothetical protein Tco_1522094 [Tanacetum coccineum]